MFEPQGPSQQSLWQRACPRTLRTLRRIGRLGRERWGEGDAARRAPAPCCPRSPVAMGGACDVA
eukprot:3214686-Pyramimonas_sp.AAC.1